MNRRSFLGMLGLGAVASVLPSIPAAAKPKGKNYLVESDGMTFTVPMGGRYAISSSAYLNCDSQIALLKKHYVHDVCRDLYTP